MLRAFAGLTFLILLSAADTAPAFEVADVHLSAPTTFPFMNGPILHGDRYVLRNATIVDMIATAYGVDANNVLEGPAWLEMDRFDVIAKAPPATPPETLKLMLRALLADRFDHVEEKPTEN
jgi:uncharacterized protein (TIGR03435 family)